MGRRMDRVECKLAGYGLRAVLRVYTYNTGGKLRRISRRDQPYDVLYLQGCAVL